MHVHKDRSVKEEEKARKRRRVAEQRTRQVFSCEKVPGRQPKINSYILDELGAV